jgi:hypothetical protein
MTILKVSRPYGRARGLLTSGLDAKGATHEATDEVVVAKWAPGDEGLAVFPPNSPDLATFRPLDPA